jgi:hypothetical protein
MITANTTLIAFFLATTPLAAQAPAPIEGYVVPQVPDEATKNAALMMAYEMNGNSMVRNGSIDVTGLLPLVKVIPTIPITPDKKAPK